jgi:hypothetical protein
MMHTIFLLKIFNEALEGKYKDQTEAASLTTNVATPTRLMKGWPCHGLMLGPHTDAHHHKTKCLTKTPNSESGTQTGLTNPERTPLHTLKKLPPPSSANPSSLRINALM